jgi:hypothetical protein
MLQDQMLRVYPGGPGKKKQLRQIHPKMNGCVKAEFIINPNLPEELGVGLFREQKSYYAWIRFSNGQTHPIPDYKKDFRGFAIKIMDVPGTKLDVTSPDIRSHDFILMNTKTFASSDVKSFADVLFVVTTPFKFSTLFKKIKIVFSNLPVLKNGIKAKINITNPAEISYFSTVPYRFGDETRAVKYCVMPTASNKLINPEQKHEHMLRHNLAATLKEHELIFDFCIQFQTDAVKMPIEDPTVEWDSEFVKLATIRIPTQIMDTEERQEFGDNLSFNSWHCLAEHRPLGGFNRVRSMIYEEMYSFRHKQNGIEDKEPEPGDNFFGDTSIKYIHWKSLEHFSFKLFPGILLRLQMGKRNRHLLLQLRNFANQLLLYSLLVVVS